MVRDYQAESTPDITLGEAGRRFRRIVCPVLALWAGHGGLPGRYDVPAGWSD